MDIDKLLLKVMNNEATTAEYEALELWKSESQENIQLLQELASGNKSESSYDAYDKEAAWDKVNSQLEPTAPVTNNNSNLSWYIVAAMAIIGIVTFFLMPSSNDTPTQFQSETAVMAFALEDNSNIWLREGGSTLDLKSDFHTERRVALNGEAYFDIAPDSEKPFIIEVANEDYIKVIGTSFNVLNDGSNFDLTVYSGVVELHTLDRMLTLTKNDRVTRINGAMVKVKNNDLNKLSWKTKELVFENTALNQVFEALEAHYKVNIQVESDNSYAKCRIRTRYTKESISKVMKELSAQFNFQYEIKADNISITGLSCK